MPVKEFVYTGGWQKFDVPTKVEWIDVVIDGAGSNTTPGARVTGRIPVRGKDTLHVLVGQMGAKGGKATVGGGGEAGKGNGLKDGWSGGGASQVRLNARTGPLRGVAGGAGGESGDGGLGGRGGGDVAEAGFPAPGYVGGEAADQGLWLYESVGNATGGTQIQGGNGGLSAYETGLAGGDAADTVMGGGGTGGSWRGGITAGGGGGGGGFRGGGGGQAGFQERSPGGGGGGGSSYVGGLTGYSNVLGGGSAHNGRVTLSWTTPGPANQPPTPPTEVKVGGLDYADEMATVSTGTVKLTAKVNDPNSKDVKMIVYYAPNPDFRQRKVLVSDAVKRGKRAEVTLTGLTEDTLWHVRLYTRDPAGLLSRNYTSLRFWSNRAPSEPVLTSPGDNATVTSLDSPVFSWRHVDADSPDGASQQAFNLQWRRAGTAVTRPGEWQDVKYRTRDSTYVGEQEEFKANTTYEWHVRTQDKQDRWGAWSQIRSFYVSGTSAPPWPVSPSRGEALDFAEPILFEWRFRDPNPGAEQRSADVRYRPVGSPEWFTITGDSINPGPMPTLELALDALPAGHYEWQVRTLSSKLDTTSDWSDSERFFVVSTRPATTTDFIAPTTTIESRLGCGDNEVHVYRRGGRYYCGRITPVAKLTWSRKRDDISNCTIDTNGSECPDLLRDIHAWTHEIVIYRNANGKKDRVWEGPIARITDTPTGLQIEAKDVMNYPYRRIMRQGYNDAYRMVNNAQVGQRTVVQRARQILMNALAPDDPNVLSHLTSFDFPDDAVQSRAVPDFAKMSWEEVDDMASTAGLDYTTIGRRIMLWDTHRPIGRLPEMRTEHFSDPPVISEYGMLLATDFGVTNNNGLYGLASVRGDGDVGPYGLVEQLASAYGETEGGGSVETLTSVAQANLEQTLTVQAQRSISSRWPTPQIVRVPDNSALSAETPVQINHLVPGVWIPLRARGTVRTLSQWQKLDVLSVEQTSEGEKVFVVMSPAPNQGADPDAEGGLVE